jgi:hypothetical protein
VDFNVRPLDELTHDEIVQLARARAASGEPFNPLAFSRPTDALTYERAYVWRRTELETQEG